MVGKIEMGLQLSLLLLSPLLNRATSFADFQFFGNLPSRNDLFIRACRDGAMISAESFNNLALILSKPSALFVFIFCSWIFTKLLVTRSSWKLLSVFFCRGLLTSLFPFPKAFAIFWLIVLNVC